MDRYADGDDAAFSELYDHVAPRLYAYLVRQTRDRSRTEDLVQQALLCIHRGRGTFIRGAQVLPWAFGIARRLLIDSIRHERRSPTLVHEEDPGTTTRASSEATPEEILHGQDIARRLARELGRLPEAQRVAFELLKQDGLSLSEAAQVLGTSVTAVKLRAHRAYVALRSALGDEVAAAGGAS